ncbi:hypothetical protein A2U01_0068914, partial [Trifolium medium]|nr:hypothetical protein [Trifolium medium]
MVELGDFGLTLVSNMGLVGLVKGGLLCDGTKLKLLETNNGVRLVSECLRGFAGYKVESMVDTLWWKLSL